MIELSDIMIKKIKFEYLSFGKSFCWMKPEISKIRREWNRGSGYEDNVDVFGKEWDQLEVIHHIIVDEDGLTFSDELLEYVFGENYD